MQNNINTQINLEQIQFYVTSSKKQIVCYDIHPTQPYMVIGYDNGKIVIWDFKNRRKIREFSLENVVHGILDSRTIEDKLKVGKINTLRFYDRDVIDSGGSRKDVLYKPRNRTEFLDLWIIIVTDSRVLFFDYVGSNTRELKLQDLGGKEQKACELFWEGDFDKMIAFGGADGNVRIWDFSKWQLAKTLVGTKGGITKLISFPLTNNGVGIASIDGIGQLNMYDVIAEKLMISEKAHKGEIENITYDPLSHTLVTSGADKNVFCWDLLGSKIKSATYKDNLSFVSSFSHARSQTTSIIFTNKDKASVLHGVIDSGVKPVTMFPIQIPNDKKAKITNLTLHPINHNIIFVEINKESLYIYNYDPYYPPNIAVSKKVIYWEEQSHVKHNSFEENTKSLFFSSSTLCKVGPWNPSERVALYVSPSGSLLAAFSNAHSRVDIYDLNNKGKKVFEAGVKSFCWSKTHEKFAILLQLEKNVEVKGSFRSKKNVQIVSGHDLQIYQANRETNGECKIVNAVKGIETKREVNYLIDGFLLGVVLSATEKSAASLQFFSWNGNPIGHVFPEPSFVLWHPDFLYCLIAFPDKITIFKTTPSFKLILSLEFVITSAYWFRDSLFYVTDNDIGILFPNAEQSEPIPICSYLPLVDSPFVSPTPRRPLGALRILDVLDKDIIVLDLNYEIHRISINSEGIKTLILIAGGEIELAIKWAEAIQPQYHYSLSQLFCSFDYPAQSLQLSGLSLSEKFSICVKYGLVSEAAGVIEEIVDKEINQNINNKESFFRNEISVKVPKLVENFLKNFKEEDFDEKTTESFISFYTQASRVDSISKLKLIVFLVKGEKKTQLEELHFNLMEEGDFDSASFAASFINEEQLYNSLLQGRLYPKASALVRSSSNPNQQILTELVDGWNNYLSSDKSVTILKN